MPRDEQIFLIALGANLPSKAGAPEVTLRKALDNFSRHDLALQCESRFFATPCFPAGAGPDYVNAAASLRTRLSAPEVMKRLHLIEDAFGRARENRWGMRSLDLDLLAAGEAVLPSKAGFERWHDLPLEAQKKEAPEQLILPHPRLHERAFVLVPLMDVAPDWRHPVLGQTVRMLHDALPEAEKQAVRPL